MERYSMLSRAAVRRFGRIGKAGMNHGIEV